MDPMGVPDPTAGVLVPHPADSAESTAAVPVRPAGSGPAGVETAPGSSPGTPSVDESTERRRAERASGGNMLKSRLAASLAARGGNGDGHPDTRFASTVSVAADALRQSAPALASEGRQAVASTMQALVDQARAVMAGRPDLAAATGALPGNGSGGAAPMVDLRDWDTRKADEARDAFLVTALRLVTVACFNLAATGAGGNGAAGNSPLADLSTNLSVHLDRLKPELAAPGAADGNGGADGKSFPAFVQTLRDLLGQIRKSS